MPWTVHPNNKRIRYSSWDLKVEERQAYPDGCQKRRYWLVMWTNRELSVMNKILIAETILFGIWFGFVFPMLGFYKETVTWKIASQSPQSLATSCIKNKNPFDIICKKSNTRSLGIGHYYLFYFWPVPPDDYLQEVESSGWSFARGRILWMIICKRPDPPDDHLQEAGSSGW